MQYHVVSDKKADIVTDQDSIDQLIRIHHAFKPSGPIDSFEMFAGRATQIRKMLGAVMQKGQHAILYGERGVGKTSLVSTLGAILTHSKIPSPPIIRFNCDKKQTFANLWQRILKEIHISQEQIAAGFTPTKKKQNLTAADLLPEQDISPDDVRLLFQKLPIHPIIILDEIDRIEDEGVIGLLADTVKALSDHNSSVTLILVGVADTIDQLINDHRSIERALVQIQMPRMFSKELNEVMDRCLKEAQMTMEKEAQEFIVNMSRGLPHYIHLLGLHAALEAHKHNRTYIVMNDVREARDSALEDVNASISTSYNEAIHDSKQDTRHKTVLLACALAEYNSFGYFNSVDVKNELVEILKQSVEVNWFARPLADFASPRRGNILQKNGKLRHYSFRFANPLLQPYVIMKGVQDGQIEENRVWALDRL